MFVGYIVNSISTWYTHTLLLVDFVLFLFKLNLNVFIAWFNCSYRPVVSDSDDSDDDGVDFDFEKLGPVKILPQEHKLQVTNLNEVKNNGHFLVINCKIWINLLILNWNF